MVVAQFLLVGVLTAAGEVTSGGGSSTSVVVGTAGWTLPRPPQHPAGEGGQPDLRFAVAGDVGTGGAAEWRTAELMATAEDAFEFDALILLGDNVYPHGDPARLPDTVFEPFADVLDDGTDLIGVLGNHDVEENHALGQMAALGMPWRWYEQRYGEVHLIILDSTDPDSREQREFLRSALAASTATWKVVALHHPMYSAGSHGSDLETRAAFGDLIVDYGVDLVLAGHDHDYQRSKPVDGVVHIVSGGAAKVRPTGRAPFTAESAAEFHFVTLDVWGDQLVVSAFSQGGLLDSVVLEAD